MDGTAATRNAQAAGARNTLMTDSAATGSDERLEAALAGDRPDRPVYLRDAADLDALVAAHDLVLVEFYTEGCGICASMEPVLGTVARATDAVVALCNPRDDPPLVERFDVRSVPTLVVFRDGEVAGRLAEGFVSTDDLVGFVERHAR